MKQLRCKIFIILLILLIINNYSCKNDSNIKSEKKVNLFELVNNLENQSILFDSSINIFNRIDRIKLIQIDVDDVGLNLFSIEYIDKSKIKYTVYGNLKRNNFDSILFYNLCVNYIHNLINIFKTYKINNFKKYRVLRNIEESSILKFETYLYDSTYQELKSVNNEFYDTDYFSKDSKIDKTRNLKYQYVLIYKYKDNKPSEIFNQIKSQHTITKIKKNWYYYRSYENDYCDQLINWDNYPIFLKSDNLREFRKRIKDY